MDKWKKVVDKQLFGHPVSVYIKERAIIIHNGNQFSMHLCSNMYEAQAKANYLKQTFSDVDLKTLLDDYI